MMEDDNYTPLVVSYKCKNASTSGPTYLSPGIQGGTKFVIKPFK